MKTLRIYGVAALLAFSAASPALAAQDTQPVPLGAPDQRSLTIATEIIEIAFPPNMRRAMMGRAMDAMMAQARTASREIAGGEPDVDLTGIMNRYFDRVRAVGDRLIAQSARALFTAMARAYTRAFTYAELVQIRAFAGTPAGTAFLQRSMELLSDPDVARANTEYMTDALQAMDPLRIQLMEELRAYGESHERHRAAPNGGTS